MTNENTSAPEGNDASGGYGLDDNGILSLRPPSRGDLRGRPYVSADLCRVDPSPLPFWNLESGAP